MFIHSALKYFYVLMCKNFEDYCNVESDSRQFWNKQ